MLHEHWDTSTPQNVSRLSHAKTPYGLGGRTLVWEEGEVFQEKVTECGLQLP